MQIARLGIGSALAGGVLGVAAMVGVGIGVHEYSANAQTPPSATATPSTQQQQRQADRQAQEADYLSKLAANLGTTVDALKAANVTTLNQLIDEAQAAGKITADQATQAKARVTQDGGAHLGGMPFLGGDHGGPGGQGGPGKGGMRGGPAMGAMGGIAGLRDAAGDVATFLGIDQQTLMQELQSGKSLATIAQEHGKSRDDLKAELTTKFGSVIDQLIDRTFQMPQGRPGGSATPAPSTTPSS